MKHSPMYSVKSNRKGFAGSALTAGIAMALMGLLIAPGEAVSKEVTVFVRVDDVFMLESDIQPQEIDSFLAVADRHGARVMLAVIPNRLNQVTNRDGEMARQLRAFHARGHQIVQHGFDHRCPFTQTTSWEFHNPDVADGYTPEQIADRVAEGKRLLEEAIGAEVTTYVGAGYDNGVVVRDYEDLYRGAGFRVLTDQNVAGMYRDGDRGYFFGLSDYAWALTDDNYEKQLSEARQSFEQAAASGTQWGVMFHDHFTRAAYNDGITLRWFGDLLEWLSTHPDYQVIFRSVDEWMADGLD
ncbi:MAG: DUF2334 domain-containing protein [Cyclonatronaceae bacterium]